MFELSRNAFYRKLKEKEQSEPINDNEIIKYWEKIYNDDRPKSNFLFQELLSIIQPIENKNNIPIKNIYFENSIKNIANWKAPGTDCIYNYFIKYFTSTHTRFENIITEIINGYSSIDERLKRSKTILIAKKGEPSAKNLRPITLLNGMYKIITKNIAENLYHQLHDAKYFDIEQLGTFKNTQAAKEQFIFSEMLRKNNKNIKNAWLDIKKAFDSVDLDFLSKLIKILPIHENLKISLEEICKTSIIDLYYKGNKLTEIIATKGIKQGDSLSPLLFVTVMEIVTKNINKKCQKVRFRYKDNEVISINHLLFNDDIKIISNSKENMNKIIDKFKEILFIIGMELNLDKCGSYIKNKHIKNIIDKNNYYRYLGVEENNITNQKINKQLIKEEIIDRISKLMKTKLNAINLFKAINEYAISKISYYIGILNWTESEINDLDKSIRNELIKGKVHYRTANKERLYLERCNFGRGLKAVNTLHENILINIYNYFFKSNKKNCKRIDFLKEEIMKNKSPIFSINSHLKTKYNIDIDQMNYKELRKELDIRRIENIKEKINKKKIHCNLFKYLENKNIDIKRSALWLTNPICNPREEGIYCFMQDENMLKKKQETKKCPFCKEKKLSQMHLATRCGGLLEHHYTERHN